MISRVNYKNFIKLKHLTSINLSNNKIQYIEKQLFKFNIKLKHIFLHKNLITSFHLYLYNLTQLQTLRLDVNKIKTLQNDVFRNFFTKKNTLNLTSNNLACDCSMYWVRDTDVQTNIKLSPNDKCTLEIRKDLSVKCFIGKEKCTGPIAEKNCTRGQLFVLFILIFNK